MNELYELKETLCKELKEYGKKRDMKAGDLDVVDKLAHTIKNLDKVIEKYSDDYSGEYSMARGRNANRDSRGRYSSEYSMTRGMGGYSMRDGYSNERGGYSRNNDMVMELRELMEDAPDERTRMEFEKFIRKMESM